MIDALPAVLPQTAMLSSDAPPPASGGAPGAGAGDFAQTLRAFLDASDATAAPSADTTGRQVVAEDGKDLPDPPVEDDAASVDAVAVWIAALALPAAAAPAASASPGDGSGTIALDQAGASGTRAAPPKTPSGVPSRDADDRAPQPGGSLDPAALPAIILDRVIAPPSIAVAKATPEQAPPSAMTAQGIVDGLHDQPPPPPDPAKAVPPAPAIQSDPIQVNTTPQPARQVFAAAIASVGRWRDSARADDATSGIAPTPTLDALQHSAVTATQASHDAPFDLGQDRSLQRMIDRIETLRDDADARDTRIRLVPDALGTVDIAVRKQGGHVHVHFTAERPDTHALLIEAQPRLTELAQQRGVRIAETSVSTGQPGANDSGATPQPRPAFVPSAPATAEADDPAIDHRLA